MSAPRLHETSYKNAGLAEITRSLGSHTWDIISVCTSEGWPVTYEKSSYDICAPLRRRWRITQQELAFLIGLQSSEVIPRFEGGKRSPSLSRLLVCEILFGTSSRELLPGLFAELEQAVFRRGTDLYEVLQGEAGLF